MKELVEHIVRALVDQPSEVQVTQVVTGPDVLLELRVAPGDMGRVIGKNGKLIGSLRQIVQAMGLRDAKRVELELIED
jgi:hypothetical protein